MLNIIFENSEYIVCIKPVGVSSQESENENMISLLNTYFERNGENATAYPVHRLDNAVGGIMVYAKNKKTASYLSKEIQENRLVKEYLAVIHGETEKESETLEDLLFKDSKRNKSYVVKRMRKGVKKASLEYIKLDCKEYKDEKLSLLQIKLHTGRSHQIRVQFSSRKHPLLGDGKYGGSDNCNIALYSYKIGFTDSDGEYKIFEATRPQGTPWDIF